MGLGIQCDRLSSFGTIGGFVRRHDDQNNTRAFGLTCHNVIVQDVAGYCLPQRKSNLQRFLEGMDINTDSMDIKVSINMAIHVLQILTSILSMFLLKHISHGH